MSAATAVSASKSVRLRVATLYWHQHTKRFLRHTRRIEDLLELALQFVAEQRAEGIAELERLEEVRQIATARVRIEREMGLE